MTHPAGWYPDGSGRQRWWDGTAWTEDTRDAGHAASPGAGTTASTAWQPGATSAPGTGATASTAWQPGATSAPGGPVVSAPGAPGGQSGAPGQPTSAGYGKIPSAGRPDGYGPGGYQAPGTPAYGQATVSPAYGQPGAPAYGRPGGAPAQPGAPYGGAPGGAPRRRTGVVVGIIVAVVVLIVAILAVVFFSVRSQTAGPLHAVTDYNDAWDAEDCQLLVSSVTNEFWQSTWASCDSFEVDAAEFNASLQNGADSYEWRATSTSVSGSTATVEVAESWTDSSGQHQSADVTFNLVKQGGGWLVDSVTSD
ncbi:DUF2510 domain-containing protein [Miniimonas sp. S16]|uniref:DUF2510 domain-containing protein n=1 Tax=Miniimonas sp. S16 TaxID=2171623 RepID=UPI000D527B53|nr:DUF2510 domain-containing protein [Miniimonas sp. S16]